MPGHKLHDHTVMHLSMLSRWEGRPGIGGGFDSSHRPVVGTFDRFNGLSSTFLLTFSCYFDNPQIPWGGAFEQKLSAQFKCPAYARPPLFPPPPPPSSLTSIGALMLEIHGGGYLGQFLLAMCYEPQRTPTQLLLGDLRFEYDYKIKHKNDFSILVCRLHVIISNAHFHFHD